jgi:hypothetical protein
MAEISNLVLHFIGNPRNPEYPNTLEKAGQSWRIHTSQLKNILQIFRIE